MTGRLDADEDAVDRAFVDDVQAAVAIDEVRVARRQQRVVGEHDRAFGAAGHVLGGVEQVGDAVHAFALDDGQLGPAGGPGWRRRTSSSPGLRAAGAGQDSIFAPQLPQNRLSAGISAPQFGQFLHGHGASILDVRARWESPRSSIRTCGRAPRRRRPARPRACRCGPLQQRNTSRAEDGERFDCGDAPVPRFVAEHWRQRCRDGWRHCRAAAASDAQHHDVAAWRSGGASKAALRCAPASRGRRRAWPARAARPPGSLALHRRAALPALSAIGGPPRESPPRLRARGRRRRFRRQCAQRRPSVRPSSAVSASWRTSPPRASASARRSCRSRVCARHSGAMSVGARRPKRPAACRRRLRAQQLVAPRRAGWRTPARRRALRAARRRRSARSGGAAARATAAAAARAGRATTPARVPPLAPPPAPRSPAAISGPGRADAGGGAGGGGAPEATMAARRASLGRRASVASASNGGNVAGLAGGRGRGKQP